LWSDGGVTSRFEKSRLFAGADLSAAFDVVRLSPLPEVFPARVGLMPNVTSVSEATEPEWASMLGQSRRIHTGDGGSTKETLVGLDAPNSFSYELSEISGPLRFLVRGLTGRWSCAAESGGTRVTWTWDVEPRSVLTAPLLPVLGRFWQPFAAKALELMDARLVR
jgi:hypothetical protein